MEDIEDDGPSGMMVPSSLKAKNPMSMQLAAINAKEKLNWLAHILFLRQDFVECEKLIQMMLQDSDGRCEYATYLKALILRVQGNIHESLELFKKCHLLNPTNADYLKQFGRSLYLIGRHKAAIEVFDECLNLCSDDWEVFYYKGLSYKYLRIYDEAIANFTQANVIHKHEATYIELGRMFQMK